LSQLREEKFKAEAAAKAAAEEAAKVRCSLQSSVFLQGPSSNSCPVQLSKMSPEELERLRNRCKKFGTPFPGEYCFRLLDTAFDCLILLSIA
jgi:hypothetical protein